MTLAAYLPYKKGVEIIDKDITNARNELASKSKRINDFIKTLREGESIVIPDDIEYEIDGMGNIILKIILSVTHSHRGLSVDGRYLSVSLHNGRILKITAINTGRKSWQASLGLPSTERMSLWDIYKVGCKSLISNEDGSNQSLNGSGPQ
jgi:hypothetical protein